MCSDRWLQLFTPFIVRILARRADRSQTPITADEIAKACGKPVRWVDAVSQMDNWEDLKLSEIRAFMAACNMHPAKFFKARFYLIRTLTSKGQRCFMHVMHLPSQDRDWVERLIDKKANEIHEIIKRELGRGRKGTQKAKK